MSRVSVSAGRRCSCSSREQIPPGRAVGSVNVTCSSRDHRREGAPRSDPPKDPRADQMDRWEATQIGASDLSVPIVWLRGFGVLKDETIFR